MIDGYFKDGMDRFWESMAKGLVALGLSPNQVTILGLVLVLLSCGLFFVHNNPVIFGFMLAATLAFDALDGAVARLTDSASLFGAYLDAIVDRYQEIAVFLTLGLSYGYWLEISLAMSASLLISYNKARTALEIPIDNNAWPDLLERLERVIIVCLGLILLPIVDLPWTQQNTVWLSLWILAIGGHFTAMQRFFRARDLIQQHVAKD